MWHLLSFTSGIARKCYEIPSVRLDGKIILRAPILQFIIKILTRDHEKKSWLRERNRWALYRGWISSHKEQTVTWQHVFSLLLLSYLNALCWIMLSGDVYIQHRYCFQSSTEVEILAVAFRKDVIQHTLTFGTNTSQCKRFQGMFSLSALKFSLWTWTERIKLARTDLSLSCLRTNTS